MVIRAGGIAPGTVSGCLRSGCGSSRSGEGEIEEGTRTKRIVLSGKVSLMGQPLSVALDLEVWAPRFLSSFCDQLPEDLGQMNDSFWTSGFLPVKCRSKPVSQNNRKCIRAGRYLGSLVWSLLEAGNLQHPHDLYLAVAWPLSGTFRLWYGTYNPIHSEWFGAPQSTLLPSPFWAVARSCL